jgi:hypothetical protein
MGLLYFGTGVGVAQTLHVCAPAILLLSVAGYSIYNSGAASSDVTLMPNFIKFYLTFLKLKHAERQIFSPLCDFVSCTSSTNS